MGESSPGIAGGWASLWHRDSNYRLAKSTRKTFFRDGTSRAMHFSMEAGAFPIRAIMMIKQETKASQALSFVVFYTCENVFEMYIIKDVLSGY